MMRKKKNKFTLIEVLVAIFLVTGACFFLLQFEESYVKSSRQSLKKVQKERLIQEAYVKLLEQLYTNQISWQQIEGGNSHRFPLDAPDWEAEAHFAPVAHDTTETITQSLMDVKIVVSIFHHGEKESTQPEIRLCLKKEELLNVEAPKT